MKSFARHTKLSNICGRVDYITNEKKQEEIVCHSEIVDFKEYAEFERNNKKTAIKNNEGREVVVSIPNEWYELPRNELYEKCQHLAEIACNKKTDMTWACHWNKDRTNLHIHVVFSERTKLVDQEIKRYDRDVYLTNEGKVARRKADRAVNPKTGEVLPPVHRKGDIKEGGFSAKDKTYKSRNWFEGTKERLQSEMERMGVKFEEKGVLHEWHEGRGTYSYITKEKNEVIREVNRRINEFKSVLPKGQHLQLDEMVRSEIKNKNIVVPKVGIENNRLKYKMVRFSDFHKAYEYIERTRDVFNKVIGKVKEKMKSLAEHKPIKSLNDKARDFFELNQQLRAKNEELKTLRREMIYPKQDLLDNAKTIEKTDFEYKENKSKLHMLEKQRNDLSGVKGLFKFSEKQRLDDEITSKKLMIERNEKDLQNLGVKDLSNALIVAKQYRNKYKDQQSRLNSNEYKQKTIREELADIESRMISILETVPDEEIKDFEKKVKELENSAPGAESQQAQLRQQMSLSSIKKEISRRKSSKEKTRLNEENYRERRTRSSKSKSFERDR